MPAQTVLVTGATGFLGGDLTRRLLADGVQVRVLARSASRARPLADLGAQVITGDMTSHEAVKAAIDGVQVVYHLAGRLFEPWVPAQEYARVHVDGTLVLLEHCKRTPGLTRLVHCSTTGVLGPTGDRPAAEDAPLRPSNVYEATKAEAEQLVRGAGACGLAVVIARPGLVYGPGDVHLAAFFSAVLRRRFRPIGRTPVWLHPIYVNDLTAALLACGDDDRAVGECFHLAAPRPVTLAGLAQVIAQAAGTSAAGGFIPLSAARAVARAGDLLPPKVRASAPLTTSRLDFLTHSRVYDVSKAQRLIGFTASTDLAAGITETVLWYRRNGYLPAAEPAGVTAEARARNSVAADFAPHHD
ncbi:MAG: NAD-dependent epimerase/dehydratase family protein [Streptosporangiaceae bacterium]